MPRSLRDSQISLINQNREMNMADGDADISYDIFNKLRSAVDLAVELQKCILRIKAAFMSEDGSDIDYVKLRKSEIFSNYEARSRELQSIDLRPLTSDQRKAFFINIYNALTIHAVASQPKLPSSVLELQDFWRKSAYVIAGHNYSLDDIEHGILRRNKPHPSSKKSAFSDADPRRAFMVDALDARIHFALNCGAQSCPPIAVYTERNLDQALTLASQNYLGQEVQVDLEKRQIQLPSLLRWYGSDAADTETEVVRWTIPFLEEGKARQIKELLASQEGSGSEVTVTYKPYSWKLNSVDMS